MAFMSCQSAKFSKQNVIGKYEYTYITSKFDYNFDYKLDLKTDWTFCLRIGSQDCIGKWRFVSKKQIILECEKEKNILAGISAGYLSQREYTIRILNNNNLELVRYKSYLPGMPSSKQLGGTEIIILKKENSNNNQISSINNAKHFD